MPNILFQDGVTYCVEAIGREFEFQDNGDRWGNTMIKFEHDVITVEEIIKQIAPQFLGNAVAVQLNNTVTGLQKRVYQDSSLQIITAEDSLGRKILHSMYAFLISCYVYQLSGCTAKIVRYQYNSDGFLCEFSTKTSVEKDALNLWLFSNDRKKSDILFLNQYQKSAAQERFPSIIQPYNQEQLDYFDEFDFIDLSVFEDFALLAEFPIRISMNDFAKLKDVTVLHEDDIVLISGAI